MALDPQDDSKNLSELAYFWDLDTDVLSWYGDITLLFTRGISIKTGFSLQKAIDPKDWRNRFQNISLIKEYGVPVQTNFMLHVNSDLSIPVQEDLIPHLISNEGEVKQVLGRLVLNVRHLSKDISKSTSQQLDITLSSIKKRLKWGYSTCNYLLLFLKISPWFTYEREIFERIQTCMRPNDAMFQLDSDYWIFLQENTCEDLRLETYETMNYVLKTLSKLCPGGFFYDLSCGLLESDELDHQRIIGLLGTSGRSISSKSYYESMIRIEKVKPEKIPSIARVSDVLYDRQLTLAYQPIVDAQSLVPKYYECLCRQITPEKTVQGAGSFVPIAEEYGLIDYLDEQLLKQALKELTLNPDLKLSINVSAITASLSRWENILIATMGKNPHVKERLVVEVTETTVFQDLEKSVQFLDMLKATGCLVAIDDFGAGYMSFSHLKGGLANIIKIDGRYIKDLTQNLQSQSFVKTIMGLAQQCNLLTVAECVETQDHVDFLRKEGVHSFQGYFTGKPTLHRSWAGLESSVSYALNPYRTKPIVLSSDLGR